MIDRRAKLISPQSFFDSDLKFTMLQFLFNFNFFSVTSLLISYLSILGDA